MGIRVTAVSVLPQCDFEFCKEPAHYNFRNTEGKWYNGCEKHWRKHRAEPGLGIGVGQVLVSAKEARKMASQFTEKIVAYPVDSIFVFNDSED